MNKLFAGLILTVVSFFFFFSQAHAAEIFSDTFSGGYDSAIWQNWGSSTPIPSSFGIQDNFGQFAPNDYFLYRADTLPTDRVVKFDMKVNSSPSVVSFQCGEDQPLGYDGLYEQAILESNGTAYLSYGGGNLDPYNNTIQVANWDTTPGIHQIELSCIGTIMTLKQNEVTLGSVDTGVSYAETTGTSIHYGQGDSEFANYQFCDENGCSASAARTLNALAPLKIWVGLKNSDDVGVKFDLLAEAYKDTTLVGSGSLNSVLAGSSGFNNAKLNTISFTSFTPVEFPEGSQLKVKAYVRNACTGSGHNSGMARLWYNDAQANSQTGATINDVSFTYYLLNNFLLGTANGSVKKTIDVASGPKCSPFKLFGTWTVTP